MTRISKKAGTASPSFQGQYAQPLVLYLEFHLPARERKAVNPFRIILILGTGIQGQRIFQRTPLFRRHGTAKRFGNFHIQPFIGDSRKPFRRLRNAVRQRNIGLDIQNGGAIHQIHAGKMQYRAVQRMQFHPFQPDGRQPDGIGTERRTRGEHPHAHIAPQPRRPDRRAPPLIHVFTEHPDQPQMGKPFQTTNGIRMTERRLKYQPRPRIRNQAALARRTEFVRITRADAGDGLQAETDS